LDSKKAGIYLDPVFSYREDEIYVFFPIEIKRSADEHVTIQEYNPLLVHNVQRVTPKIHFLADTFTPVPYNRHVLQGNKFNLGIYSPKGVKLAPREIAPNDRHAMIRCIIPY
jgi:hypothetical protein